MRAAFIKAPYQVQFRDLPKPSAGPGELLLRIRHVGICGTDLHLAKSWATDWQRFGHEQVGVIVGVGEGVSDVEEGEWVTVQATTACAVCASCMDGRLLDCRDWVRSRALEGFSEYVVVDRRSVWRIGELRPRAAVLVEPLTVALDMLRLAEIRLHHRIAIVGPGPIGIMALALARLRGPRQVIVLGTSIDVDRFGLCRELGADVCVNVDEHDPTESVKEVSSGGVDIVLNTATARSVPSSLDMCRRGGDVIFVGFEEDKAQSKVSIDMNEMHMRRLSLRCSYAAPALGFPLAHTLLLEGRVPSDDLLTHTFAFDDLDSALSMCATHEDGVIKAVVDMPST